MHPFLTGQSIPRLIGDSYKYDVYISYRRNSLTDSGYALKIKELLINRGMNTYWSTSHDLNKYDKSTTTNNINNNHNNNNHIGASDQNQNKTYRFHEGLINARIVICLLSRNAINMIGKNHDKEYDVNNNVNTGSFTDLVEDSKCDELLLEYFLIIKMFELGLVEKVIPILIGDYDYITNKFNDYFVSNSHPFAIPKLCPKSVEIEYKYYMEKFGLGTSQIGDCNTVYEAIHRLLMNDIIQFDENNQEVAFADTVNRILELTSSSQTNSSLFHESIENQLITSKIDKYKQILRNKDNEIKSLKRKISDLLKEEEEIFQEKERLFQKVKRVEDIESLQIKHIRQLSNRIHILLDDREEDKT